MTESRLGLGWKSDRLRCWCEEGRIKAAKARFTKSPSTPPILTSEFVMADRRAFSLCGEYGTAGCEPNPLCKLHLNEPGCVVGEHIQVLFGPCRFTIWPLLPPTPRGETEMDRLGEVDRSIENRTDGADGGVPYRLTRGGEVERVKNLWDPLEKVEVEEAKYEVEGRVRN